MHRSFCHFIVLLLLLIIFQNCASSRISVREAIDDPDRLDQLINKLDTQYPNAFSFSQRIVLNIRGKQYDFLGQLMMEKNTAFRAIAFGELGGLFLDILYKNDQTSILANPSQLPEKPLKLGVAKDILQIFDFQHSGATLFKADKHRVGIQEALTDESFCEYIFDEESGLLTSMSLIDGNSVVKKILFKNYAEFEKSSVPLPSVIIVNNLEWHYSIEVHLLTFKPDFDHNKAFKRPGESE